MQVLVKADGFPTYHLAVVVDDHLMAITHVLRGEEWINSMPKHRLLYDAFGWDMPQHYHLPLLRNPDRSKLSKRKNPTGIDYYRRRGYLPEALLNYLALMGWSMPDEREIFSLTDMIENFDINRVSVRGPRIRPRKTRLAKRPAPARLGTRRLRRSLPSMGKPRPPRLPDPAGARANRTLQGPRRPRGLPARRPRPPRPRQLRLHQTPSRGMPPHPRPRAASAGLRPNPGSATPCTKQSPPSPTPCNSSSAT